MFEHFEIKNIIDSRIEMYDPSKNISWKKLKEKNNS